MASREHEAITIGQSVQKQSGFWFYLQEMRRIGRKRRGKSGRK